MVDVLTECLMPKRYIQPSFRDGMLYIKYPQTSDKDIGFYVDADAVISIQNKILVCQPSDLLVIIYVNNMIETFTSWRKVVANFKATERGEIL